MKNFLLKMIFLGGLALGLVMSLAPNRYHHFNMFLPAELRSWVNANDNAANLGAFFLLASVALRLPRLRVRDGSRLPAAVVRLIESRLGAVAALMLLVCAIEFAQIFIPGRAADIQDVATGWSGIFAAWLLAEIQRD